MKQLLTTIALVLATLTAGAQTLNVTVGSACVAVGTGSCSTVPEPAGYGLAALALLGALAPSAWRRRCG